MSPLNEQWSIQMKLMSKALFGVALLAMTAGTASAAVVCNDDGDCWRVKGRPTYGPGVQLRIYEDNWKGDGVKFRWREPGRGHGYYRNGVWVEIR
jgi:hypothetical protein